MKFQIASDIHLEKIEDENFNNILIPSTDHLILAGDIFMLSHKEIFCKFMKWCSEKFKFTFYITGNHEYRNDNLSISETDIEINTILSKYDNVIFLNDNIWFQDDVLIIGTTLWTNITEPHNEKLSTSKIRQLHEKNKRFLETILATYNNTSIKIIIITHHLPSYKFLLPQYKNKYNNIIFATNDMNDLISKYKSNIDYWIFGHTHSCIDCVFHGIRFVCNPRGYSSENGYFNQKKLIIV